ncbi:MAG: hypothetical protein ACD_81C00037G0006 [uncultured bacterium]|uniref:histidine kinase n=2 Tax=Candidatus Wolfeibacteriota TaxID=1752735 RepID=A0A0G1HBG6_9BACT|nr:MAG: hypothetical protein ACD_81C00037G0006 [uncultured bacterium]KKR12945.1 MAG: PAS/PAC sensor signal transduction histidine kinase [Candidatus Wolfebacteria bacterium GW2011_GWC2_39_22]KKT43873.1 MAG: PAS/PAC sensor signal transduction histidine kinase [Candidatus Wolfebacteria bacterium GW2011_GWE2_44_13]
MQPRISFKRKLILTISVIVLFFGTLVLIMTFQINNNIASQLGLKHVESIAIQQGSAVEVVFTNAELFTKQIASQHIVVDYLQQKSPALQNPAVLESLTMADAGHTYESINIMDISGVDLVSTNPMAVGQSFAFREYFKQAAAGTPTMEGAISAVTKTFGYYFSHPVINADGKVLGIIAVKLKPDILNTAVRPAVAAAESTSMIVDEHGIVVQSNRPEMVFRSLGALTPEVQREISDAKRFGSIAISSLQYDTLGIDTTKLLRTQSQTIHDPVHERDEIIGITRIGNTSFALVIEETRETFIYTAKQLVVMGGIIIALLLIIMSVILAFLIERLLRPLETITKAVEQLNQGNFAQPIVIKTGDEFEHIGNALGALSQRLGTVYGNIEEKIWERAADFEKFKLAVESASDHIIITDLDGRVIYANKAAENITGYSRAELVGNRPSLWGKMMSSEFYKDLWETIKTKKKVFVGEITNKRKNGELYVAELRITPLIMDKGLLYGFVGIERDITVQKEVDRVKTEFVSIASHQLRTPLAVINWYIEMLTKEEVGTLNKEQRKYLEQVYLASKRMVELVNSLLSVSRIDMGAFYVEPEPVLLATVIDSVLEESKQIIEKKALHIKTEYDASLKEMSADPSLLRVIFQNLIGNAIKYTPQGGSVSISIKKQPDQKHVAITITDTGYGIPAKQQSKIFTKFFRADNAREKEPDGNGLGLYIVKAIIKEIKGSIEFTSEEDKGTTFSILLPLTSPKNTRQKEPSVK